MYRKHGAVTTQKKERQILGVRKFRETFPNLTEETEVIRSHNLKRLGVWTPAHDEADNGQTPEGPHKQTS